MASHQHQLRSLQAGAEAADAVLQAVRAALARDDAGAVWAASEKEGIVTVLVAQPAQATRLHYALPALKDALTASLGRPVGRVVLKVRPAPG